MAQRIPTYTTGVDVWSYFAAHLYSNPVLPIVVRELFQNARDACRRADRPPRIVVAVLGDEPFQHGRVICQDNGCGMDEDTILDRFLCLGASDKARGDTGGFGIAKAVILGGCTWWEVRTHPSVFAPKGSCLCLSLDHLREQRPVDGLPSQGKGTRITLRYDPLPEHDPRHTALRFHAWHLAQALSWLVHSDTPCTLVARAGAQHSQVWHLAGMRTGQETVVASGGDGRTTWALHQAPPRPMHPFCYTPPGGCPTEHRPGSAGRLFVRLGGLVQFDEHVGEHPDCWILDLDTAALPKDADYPLSLSREKLSKALQNVVSSVLEPHQRNPVTSHRRQFRRHERPATIYYRGSWLGRSGEPMYGVPDGGRLAAAQEIACCHDAALRASVFAQAVSVVPNLQQSPLGFAIQVKGTDRTRRDWLAPHNLRLLTAWARVVDLVIQANHVQERFGVGFVFDGGTFAERIADGQGIFYMINPCATGISVSHAPETLLRMFVHAGHEVAHACCPDHGEHHSSHMGELLCSAAGSFWTQQTDLVNELRGGKGSALVRGLQLAFDVPLDEA